jgi:gamma-glutamylputrescine oxidase
MPTTSFWQSEGAHLPDRALPTRRVEVLVIGAGLIGAAAAYHAQQMGRNVVITDMMDVAMGASGRNAGFMITGLDSYYHKAIKTYGRDVTKEMWDVSTASIAFWKEVVARSQESNAPVQFSPVGSLLLAESEEEAQDLADAYEALRADGFDMIFHENDPLNRGYYAAIENKNDAAVQPYQLAHALIAQSDAEVIAGNRVYDIVQIGDVVRVLSQKYVFEADYVMLCTNAYSAQVDAYFADKVMPMRAQVLLTEPLDKPVLPSVGYSGYGYMYYRMTFDNRLLIGGARDKHFDSENHTTEDIVSAPVQASLDAYMQKHFPDVQAKVARRWGGIMGFSVDGLPLVGTLPHAHRVGFAVGFTGHGISMGAETARRAVLRLLEGKHAGAVDVGRLSKEKA